MRHLTLILIFVLGFSPPRSTQIHTSIVGGRAAHEGQVPYILSLQNIKKGGSVAQRHECGASLIQVNGLTLAISAAHCTPSHKLNELYLIAGATNLGKSSGAEVKLNIREIINHEGYKNFEKYTENDISLLFLNESVEFSKYIQPIKLPKGENIDKGYVTVSGWGLLSEDAWYASDKLMTVVIPVVNDEECGNAYSRIGTPIHDYFLCAGMVGVGKADACTGDSGGPAMQDGILVGIVSFGKGCGRARYLGVYTEVSYFLGWINENVKAYQTKNNDGDIDDNYERNGEDDKIISENNSKSNAKTWNGFNFKAFTIAAISLVLVGLLLLISLIRFCK